MIELNRHIEILLLSNDCVIVPGFGGFMAHHVDARYEAGDHMFLPPLRTIGFNPNLTVNDSLLAQSYVEAYDLSYPEALRRIESEVEILRSQLDSDGYYELTGIGTISRNDNGNYEFEPFEAGILTPEYYGLSGFEMYPINLQEGHNPITSTPSDVQKTIDSPAPTSTDSEEDREDTEKARIVSIPVTWLRAAAAIVIAVMTVFMLPEQIGSHPMEASSTLNVGWLSKMLPSTVTIPSPIVVEEEDVLAVEPSSESYNESENIEEVPAEELNQTSQPDDYYCVVLASLVSKKNGNEFISRLADQGFNDAALMERTSGNKVVYGRYSTEQEAYNMKRQLSRNKETSDCWVMHVRP